MPGGCIMSMRIYISYNKIYNGARVAYACANGETKNFYYRKFRKDSNEQDAFDYIMKYVNSFLDNNDETFFIVSNNKKIIKIIDNSEDTEHISFIGKYDSEEARDVFMKLQVAISMREKLNHD